MHEMTLTLQFTPQSLVRVGLGPERTVYVPIQQEKNGSARLHRHDQPVWSNEEAEVFIVAYPDHIEVTLAVHTHGRHASGALSDVG